MDDRGQYSLPFPRICDMLLLTSRILTVQLLPPDPTVEVSNVAG
jgi:hypothetical protein